MIRCLTTRGGPQERLVPTAWMSLCGNTANRRLKDASAEFSSNVEQTSEAC